MKSPTHLFADLTALLEDLHGLTVEGQRPTIPDEELLVIVGDLFAGIAKMRRKTAKLARRLEP